MTMNMAEVEQRLEKRLKDAQPVETPLPGQDVPDEVLDINQRLTDLERTVGGRSFHRLTLEERIERLERLLAL